MDFPKNYFGDHLIPRFFVAESAICGGRFLTTLLGEASSSKSIRRENSSRLASDPQDSARDEGLNSNPHSLR